MRNAGMALLLLAGCCNCKNDRCDYRDADLRVGMTAFEAKQQLGEPDNFAVWWDNDKRSHSEYSGSRLPEPKYIYAIEELRYGVFGAHNQKVGHVTKHRLTLRFVDGHLYDWNRSAPIP